MFRYKHFLGESSNVLTNYRYDDIVGLEYDRKYYEMRENLLEIHDLKGESRDTTILKGMMWIINGCLTNY